MLYNKACCFKLLVFYISALIVDLNASQDDSTKQIVFIILQMPLCADGIDHEPCRKSENIRRAQICLFGSCLLLEW